VFRVILSKNASSSTENKTSAEGARPYIAATTTAIAADDNWNKLFMIFNIDKYRVCELYVWFYDDFSSEIMIEHIM